MNEWGTPDWQNVASYGETTRWSSYRWHWEFLRRRQDIRTEFQSLADETYQRKLMLFKECPDAFPDGRVLRPDEPGFGVTTSLIRGSRSNHLPNPTIGDQPELSIWFDSPGVSVFYSEEAPEGYERVDFDLSKPLGPQLAAAKEFLEECQQSVLGKKLQKRQHKSKWLTYLRVLDGREQGASWSELSEILLNMRDDPQAARDVYQQAEALRFNF